MRTMNICALTKTATTVIFRYREMLLLLHAVDVENIHKTKIKARIYEPVNKVFVNYHIFLTPVSQFDDEKFRLNAAT